MESDSSDRRIQLATDRPVWDQVFGVFPLVIVGSKEDHGYDLAPKHMAIPLGWGNYYGFVCSPQHSTYANIRRHGAFTVSYPRPTELLIAAIAAAPRCDDHSKPSLQGLPTFPARQVDGVLVKGCYLFLECKLHQVLDGFGPNSLIIGEVVAATADQNFVRTEDRNEAEQIYQSPLLAYVNPGRFAEIRQTTAFPFPKGFAR